MSLDDPFGGSIFEEDDALEDPKVEDNLQAQDPLDEEDQELEEDDLNEDLDEDDDDDDLEDDPEDEAEVEQGDEADEEEGETNDVIEPSKKRKRVTGKSRKKRQKKKVDGDEESHHENGNGVENEESTGSSEEEETENQELGKEDSAKSKKKTKGKKRVKKKKASHTRRNIKGILTEENLTETTKEARAEEAERLRRLMGVRHNVLEVKPASELLQPVQLLLRKPQDDLNGHGSGVIHLTSSDEEPGSDVILKPMLQPSSPIAAEDNDSDIEILSDSQIYQQEDEIEEDPERLGLHVDDRLNIPEPDGQILVNVNHPPEDDDVYLAPQFQGVIKPHQVGGLRFLYDNVIESTSRYDQSNGFGCILAHSMGLGKTLQLVAFSDIFLRHTSGKRVLCIVPINTVQNWLAEFNHWVPAPEDLEEAPEEMSHFRPRNFQLHLLNDSLKNLEQRATVILNWKKYGGVLLMGYELYRLLATKTQRKKRKPKNSIVCVDLEEESKEMKLLDEIHKLLVNPGPDLVICDEGHRIKNSIASTSLALKSIRTKRRVVLTGYPLQNNLMEYWCMVDFVRPNYLGTKTEFSNMFERPIQNGQCIDSTPRDVRLMMHRVHVLQQQLQGFVQRRGHQVLRLSLPPKREYVLLLRMTPYQRKLYKLFMEEMISQRSVPNPLRAFAICCKIWNHPDILYNFVRAKEESVDLDLEWDEVNGTTRANSAKGSAKKKFSQPIAAATPVEENPLLGGLVNFGPGFSPFASAMKKEEFSFDWASSCFENYFEGDEENSYKLVLFLDILEETIQVGDRLLFFSQSLLTLNLVEEFLKKRTVPDTEEEYWCPNYNYFRLDGSTPAQERERLINAFNADDNVKLFLVSTRAGSLGINLVGANRVIVFDASWNPCHDSQAVCRVYRYGQTKVSHIYRFVTDNSLEKKIYDRQVNKQGMADRVVDESNPEARLYTKEIQCLIADDEDDPPPDGWDVDKAVEQIDPNDEVLARVIGRRPECLTQAPFTHESLLVDRKEKKLSRAEKRMALQNFEMERNSKISYSRPSYTAYYPKPEAIGPSGQDMVISPRMYNNDQPPFYSSSTGQPLPSTSTSWAPNMFTGPPADPYTSSALRKVLEAKNNIQNRDFGYPGSSYSQPTHNHPAYPVPSGMGQVPPPVQPLSPYVQSKVPPGDPLLSAVSSKFPIDALMKQKDVIVQQLTLDKDMTIPTNNGNPSTLHLTKGEEVIFIRTPKGMYLKHFEKIIKIKLNAAMMANFRSTNSNGGDNGQPPQVVTLDSSDSDGGAQLDEGGVSPPRSNDPLFSQSPFAEDL